MSKISKSPSSAATTMAVAAAATAVTAASAAAAAEAEDEFLEGLRSEDEDANYEAGRPRPTWILA